MTTHNLAQGQKLADRMAILSKGRICQNGTPKEIFRKSKNKFVADFICIENLMTGEVETDHKGLTSIKTDSIRIFALTEKRGTVNFSVRPDEITVSKKEIHTSARNIINGQVKEITDTGYLIKLMVYAGELFTVFIT